MHEMPMTIAPMRPTDPAERPFFEMPCSEPSTATVASVSGACGSGWCVMAVSFSGGGARYHDHGHREFAQHLRRGRTEEQVAGGREAARADEHDLAVVPVEAPHGLLDGGAPWRPSEVASR